jgi:hypothetical protein
MLAMALNFSCSEGDNESKPSKWCVINICDGYQEDEQRCIEIESQRCQKIGENYNGYKLTEKFCGQPYYPPGIASIKEEKPDGCIVLQPD